MPRLCGAFFLNQGHLIELPGTWARSADGRRSLASGIWCGRAAVPTPLEQRAAQLAGETPAPPGRVHDLGRFEEKSGPESLRACLPDALAAALRPQLQWYGCRGAGFHTDAHYSSVLFGAWCLSGPPRNLVFADPTLRVACPIGALVVFDPFQPHAVLDLGQERYDRDRYVDAAASVFLAFEVELTAPIRAQFGIGPAEAGAFSISSNAAVNAETGQVAR